MSDPFVGMILPFPYSFAPQGWAFCQGQTLSPQQNQVLYALIGTTFGGQNQTSFNLPDLRSRVMIGARQGTTPPGLTPYLLGDKGGKENVSLGISQLPAHSHTATFTPTGGSAGSPLSVTVQVSQNVTGNKNIPDATYQYLGGPIRVWVKQRICGPLSRPLPFPWAA